MKINSVTKCFNQETFQPTIKVEMEISLELMQDVYGLNAEDGYTALGKDLIDSIKAKLQCST